MNVPQQEMAPLSKLKGADYNPRDISTTDLQKLVAAIAEFGLVQPIVARREDGLIIGGHQRAHAVRLHLEASGKTPEEIDATQVPVVYMDGLDDTKTKVLNLALNKISGTWDYDKLATVLESLGTPDDSLFQLSGFSMDEAEDILQLVKTPEFDDAAGVGSSSSGGSSGDPDAMLAEKARQFAFEVASAEEAEVCAQALKEFGATSPSGFGLAFVALCRAGLLTKKKAA